MEDWGTTLGQPLHATPEESLTNKESHTCSFFHTGHWAVAAQGGGGTKMKLSVFRKGDHFHLRASLPGQLFIISAGTQRGVLASVALTFPPRTSVTPVMNGLWQTSSSGAAPKKSQLIHSGEHSLTPQLFNCSTSHAFSWK